MLPRFDVPPLACVFFDACFGFYPDADSLRWRSCQYVDRFDAWDVSFTVNGVPYLLRIEQLPGKNHFCVSSYLFGSCTEYSVSFRIDYDKMQYCID